jgi:hypothetical protein
MKNLAPRLLCICAVVLVLSACTVLQPDPTLTPTPQPPTATSTPLPPTATPEPTATSKSTTVPTEKPQFEFGEVQELPTGGFSFRQVKGYDVEFNEDNGSAGLGVFDPDGKIIISFNGVTTYYGVDTPEEIMDEFLRKFEEKGIGEYHKSQAYPIIVADVEGIAVDLTGTTFDREIEGQAILVMPSDNQFLYGFAIGVVKKNENSWEDQGRQLFSAMLDTIQFIAAPVFEGSACEVATDKTYGYSKDNPVRVAGDWMEGPARERAYLDSLCGPDGEQVSYQRLGSEGYGETILDKYEVTYEGANKMFILYIDMYEFEPLMAPVGFKCWIPFPLSELYQE